MANPHPFIIPILWICILELVFIELVLGIVLNTNCIVICIVLCCLMNVCVHFVNVPYIYKKGICICVYICHNIKEKKYIYKYIYIKKRKGKEKTSYEKGIFDSCF